MLAQRLLDRLFQRGRKPLVTGEEGRIVVAMFTAIYLSAKLQRPVRFPLKHGG